MRVDDMASNVCQALTRGVVGVGVGGGVGSGGGVLAGMDLLVEWQECGPGSGRGITENQHSTDDESPPPPPPASPRLYEHSP
jgi:hypothetical protein